MKYYLKKAMALLLCMIMFVSCIPAEALAMDEGDILASELLLDLSEKEEEKIENTAPADTAGGEGGQTGNESIPSGNEGGQTGGEGTLSGNESIPSGGEGGQTGSSQDQGTGSEDSDEGCKPDSVPAAQVEVSPEMAWLIYLQSQTNLTVTAGVPTVKYAGETADFWMNYNFAEGGVYINRRVEITLPAALTLAKSEDYTFIYVPNEDGTFTYTILLNSLESNGALHIRIAVNTAHDAVYNLEDIFCLAFEDGNQETNHVKAILVPGVYPCLTVASAAAVEGSSYVDETVTVDQEKIVTNYPEKTEGDDPEKTEDDDPEKTEGDVPEKTEGDDSEKTEDNDTVTTETDVNAQPKEKDTLGAKLAKGAAKAVSAVLGAGKGDTGSDDQNDGEPEDGDLLGDNLNDDDDDDGEGDPNAEVTAIEAAIAQALEDWKTGLAAFGNKPAEIFIERGTEGQEPYKAGDQVKYNITYTFAAQPEYQASTYDKPFPIFASYDDVVITVELPEGLQLDGCSTGYTPHKVEGTNKYNFVLLNSITGATAVEFEITAFITGNGTENAIRDIGSASAKITAYAMPLDYNTKPYRQLENLFQTYSDSKEASGFSTVSNDEWGTQKSVLSAVISDDRSKATVTYKIQVGMMKNGALLTNGESEEYQRTGRDAFDAYGTNLVKAAGIYDVPAATFIPAGSTTGSTITPNSVMISKSGGVPVPLLFETPSDFMLTDELALNTVSVLSDKEAGTYTAVPTYTEYIVTAEYSLTAGMIDHFETPGSTLKFDNTETLKYMLANKEYSEVSSSASTTLEVPVKNPATLVLTKYLRAYTGTSTDTYDGRYGDITYYIASGDGTTAFKLYNEVEGVYTPIGDAAASHVITAGTTYYLTPGIEYVITEALTTDQAKYMRQISDPIDHTPAENEQWYPSITNDELAGTVTVIKLDDRGYAVEGAVFTLSNGSGYSEARTTRTAYGGKIIFDKVPFGTYTLEETVRPDNFQGGFSDTITIGDEAPAQRNYEITVTNRKNFVDICLTKYADAINDKAHMNTAPAGFGNFVLQRSAFVNGEWGEWTDVPVDLYNAAIGPTVNGSGQISPTVAAFDDNGNIYKYRFKETVASGWYDITDPDASVVYSDEIMVTEDVSGVIKAKTGKQNVSMYNRKKVSITASKQFWDVDTNTIGKLVQNTSKSANITLYRYDGETMTQVQDTKTVSSTNPATWSGLYLYEYAADGTETKISYYVAEEDVAGYSLDITASGGKPVVIGGKTYLPVSVSSENAEKTLYNVEQTVPVVVYKKNYYTKGFVSGSAISVTDAEGHEALNAKTGEAITGKTVPEGGYVLYLKPGQKYTLDETTVPSTYYKVTGAQEIDVTNTVVPYGTSSSTVPVKKYTIYNKQDPLIRIRKTDGTNTDTALLDKAVIELFTKNADGKYEPAKDASGNRVPPINPSASYTSIRLVPGTYYAAETTTPEGYIDPNKHPEEYSGLGCVEGDTVDGHHYLFAVLDVKDAQWSESGKTDNTYSVSITNRPDTAELKVIKKIDGEDATVGGFKVMITTDLEGYGPFEAVIGSDGTVEVQDLKLYGVYNGAERKIKYTVTEEDIPEALGNTYYIVNADGGEKELSRTETTGFTVENATYTSLEANKFYRNGWEYWFTKMEYPQAGVTVGLFEQQVDGSWKAVTVTDGTTTTPVTLTTDSSGYIKFDKLRRDRKYAVVELSCTDPLKFPFVPTDDSGNGRFVDFAGNVTTISAADLNNYNYCILDKEGSERENVENVGNLINQTHWVQFDITKWMDGPGQLTPEDPGYHQLDKEGENKDGKLDNAVFRLYRYVVHEGTTAVTFSKSTWDLVGEYTSGTLYTIDQSGDVLRQVGEFRTNVDQEAAKNVVYLLVETNAGPGGGILLDDEKYNFYHAYGTSYTVTVPEATGTVGSETYNIDKIKYDDVLNGRSEDPGGAILVGTMRLAKWKDTFDENAEPKGNYTPLPNTTFGIYLDEACTNLLETVTTGLDADLGNKAWAQTGAYSLQMTNHTDTTGTFRNYLGDEDDPRPGVEVPVTEIGNTGAYQVLGVKVYVKELSAPEGFTYIAEAKPMYFAFVWYYDNTKTNPKVFNDAYFVTDAAAAVPLIESQTGVAGYVTWGDSETEQGSFSYSGQYRIVDYPKLDTLVRVQKFGYTPTAETVGKTSDELNAMSIGQKPLKGVVMYLQRKDENNIWNYWDYANGTYSSSQVTFTTKADGSYLFAKGLPEGTYRIWEDNIGSGNSAYEIAYNSPRFRVFTVGSDPRTVTLYNPTKAELKITKKDADGNVIPNAFFTLTPTPSGPAITKETTETAPATFTGLSSNTYKLSESVDGYTGEYLSKYIDSLPEGDLKSNLTALTSENGAQIGYTYASSGTDSEKEYVVSAIGLTGVSVEMTVQNPKLCDLELVKVDPTVTDTVKTLAGAKFTEFYMPFSRWSGTMTVGAPEGTTQGWFTVSENVTTGTDGKISLTGQKPGIYAFKETAAPSGYDIIKNTDNKDIYYYVIVTGGMDITVEGLPATETYKIADGEQRTISVLTVDGTASVTVPDIPKVGATAKKAVTSGKITDTLEWTVTLKLYESANSTAAIGTATVKSTDTEPVVFKNGQNPTQLSKGRTYYVEETAAADYELTGMKVNGKAVTAEEGTALYPVYVSETGDVTIEATNRYLRAHVKFLKVDETDTSTLLSGAYFTVTRADGTTVTGATVNEIEGELGHYFADIPLNPETADTPIKYYIVETTAPDGYILEDGIRLEVKLDAEENNNIDWTELDLTKDENEGKYIPNTKGKVLKIQKIATVHSASSKIPAGKEDAYFTLFHYDEATSTWSESEYKGTDEEGRVQWLLIPGDSYAINERTYNSLKFIGLDGWYDSNGNKIDASFEEITVGDHTEKVYVLRAVSADLYFEVYNKPYLSARIVKADIGGYPENVVPTTGLKIYKLESELPSDYASAAAVISNLTDESLVANAPTATNVLDESGSTTYAIWDRIDPTQNYVIVESGVNSTGTERYNTLNKSYGGVVWFASVPAVEDPDPTVPRVFELDNVYGDAAVSLSKAVVENAEAESYAAAADTDNAVKGGTVESLLKGSRKVIYTVTPTVTSHNQALDEFVITDSGLTFTGVNVSGETVSIDNGYEISSIVIGSATQSIDEFRASVSEDAKVSAKVTWYKNGAEQTETVVMDLSSARTLSVPGLGYTGFTVEYYSQAVRDATEIYSLGYEFTPGPVTVYAAVSQQTDGYVDTDGTVHPVVEISRFTNSSAVDMTYPVWDPYGEMADPEEKHAESSASVNVASIDYPKITIEKTVSPNPAPVEEDVEYTIVVTNMSETEPFEHPVILDMLPAGVRYKNDSLTVTGGEFTAKLTQYTGGSTLNLASGSGGSSIAGAAETAFVVDLDGTLAPSASVTVRIMATVYNSALLYGEQIDNFAFASSPVKKYHLDTNPYAYSFRNAENSYPGVLQDEVRKFDSLSDVATEREEALRDVLGDYDRGNDYIWVRASASAPTVLKASLYPKKAIHADQDAGGFNDSSNFLATATRTNSTFGDETSGWVNYRLTVSNGTDKNVQGLIIGDVLSKVGDGRESVWDVVFKQISEVSFPGSGSYWIYYYTGAVSGAETELRTRLSEANKWGEGTAWPQTGSTNPELNWYAPDYAPVGETITAFIIVFDYEHCVLKPGQSFYVIYETTVKDYPNDAEFAKVAFENTNNTFWVNWVGSKTQLKSNQVSATVSSGRVKVAGDVWIDEDWDGRQESANRRDYEEYAIVRSLLSNISFSINDERRYATSSHTDKGGTNTGSGESIKHFSFDELGAGLWKTGFPLYSGNPLRLDTDALKTSDPYNYSLDAEIRDKNLTSIFKLTSLGDGYYMSDDPAKTTDPDYANRFDNNFYETSNGKYHAVEFYLPYSAEVDQSKDIGFRMERDLHIVKTAADDPSTLIQGAKFTIYDQVSEGAKGMPENPHTATFNLDETTGAYVYVPDGTGTVTELVTDENGAINVTGLNWWKEYIIKETVAAQGYDLSGAAAGAISDYTVIEPVEGEDDAWILRIPGKDKTDKTDSVGIANPRHVNVSLRAEKAVSDPAGSGYTLKGGEFKFELYTETVSETGATVQTVLDTKSNGALGEDGHSWVNFDEKTLDRAGIFTYYIREVIPADSEKIPGITYSTEVITATVTVTWDEESNKLVASTSYTNQDKVTNTYSGKVSMPLKALKVIQYIVPTNEKQFTFNIEAVTENAPLPKINGQTVTQVTVTGAHAVSFGEIEFNSVGEYKYKVTESAKPEQGYEGYTFDAAEHSVVVNVTGAGGKLTWTCTVDGTTTFTQAQAEAEENPQVPTVHITNLYEVEPEDLTIPVKKEITGSPRPVQGGQTIERLFRFSITSSDEDAPLPNPTTVEFSGEGTGNEAFNAIRYEYKDVGTWTYTVKETVFTGDDYKGYTFDTTEYTVVVTVTDTGGKLQITPSIKVGDEARTELKFVNHYEPTPDDVTLIVIKSFSDGSNARPDNWKKTFRFTLTPANEGTPMPAVTYVEITDAGVKSFGAIRYNAAGTYEYTLKEEAVDKAGYTYDTTVHNIKVTVTDKGGELEAVSSIDGTETTECKFINEYHVKPTDVVLPVKKTIPVSKSKLTPADAAFTFTLSASDPNNTPMPASGGETVTITSAEILSGGGTKNFGKITFTKAGSYTYAVSESIPDVPVPGYTYDRTTHYYNVTVTDNKGELEAVWTLDNTEAANAPEFKNPYDTTSVVIPVEKVVTGPVPEGSAREFHFTLAPKDGTNPPMPADDGNKATVVGTGSSAFGAIEYKSAGVYEYTVTETDDKYPGYMFDTGVFDVKVTVTNTAGELSTAVEYSVSSEAKDSIIFNNVYVVKPTELQLPVKKTVNGDVPKDCDKDFTFVISAKTGTTPMPESNTVVVHGAATGLFGKIKFTSAGVYEYTVSELKGKDPGYTYDETVYNVKVTVTDNNGQLEATWTADEKKVETLEFTNDYEPEPTYAVLRASKILRNLRLRPAMFWFELSDKNGVIEKVSNDGEGGVTFTPITYTEPGTYVYTITEVRGGIWNMTYDKSSFTVTVTVVDDGGKLKATVSYPTAPVFVNTYHPFIPGTGYGPKNDGLLLSLAGLSLAVLFGTKPDKKRRKKQ